MFKTFSFLAALSPLAQAAAVPIFPHLNTRESAASVNASLPNVTIFATGT